MSVLEIIENYRNADEDERLHLFLQHRELRALLIRIDEEDRDAGVAMGRE